MRRPVEPISSPGSVVRLAVQHPGSRIARTTLHRGSVRRRAVLLEVLHLGSVEATTTTEVTVADTVGMEDTTVDTAEATNLAVVLLRGSAVVVTVDHAAVLRHGKCHSSRRRATVLLAWTSTPRRPLLRHLAAFLLRLRLPATMFPLLHLHRSSGCWGKSKTLVMQIARAPVPLDSVRSHCVFFETLWLERSSF